MIRRAARAACAAVAMLLIGRGVEAQDIPIRHWLVRGPIPATAGAEHDYLGSLAHLLPDSGQLAGGGAFLPVGADSHVALVPGRLCVEEAQVGHGGRTIVPG